MGAMTLLADGALGLAVIGLLMLTVPRPLLKLLNRWGLGSGKRGEVLHHTSHELGDVDRVDWGGEMDPLLAEYQRIFAGGPDRDSLDLPPARLGPDSGPIPTPALLGARGDDFLRSSSGGAAAEPVGMTSSPEPPGRAGLEASEDYDASQLFPPFPEPADAERDEHTGSVSNDAEDQAEEVEGDQAESVGFEFGQDGTADGTKVDEAPAEPVDALAEAVVASRERIERVLAALDVDSADSGVEDAAHTMTVIRGETRLAHRRIRWRLPDEERSVAETIEAANESQERIESAIRSIYDYR